jgi:hypothetical protein
MREVRGFRLNLPKARLNELWIELDAVAGQLSALVIEPDGNVRRIESPTWVGLQQIREPVRISAFDCTHVAIQKLANDILEAALGQPPPSVHSLSLFMSPQGAVTPPHFDMPTVAVCQIEGQKLLKVQAHSRCPNPQADELVMDSGLSYEIETQLAAGDGVLIPPGHVHTTMAVTHGFTLGVGFMDW